METLQEFIAYTKGWEYLITVAFVGAFIVFWRLVMGGRATEEKRLEEDKSAELLEERQTRKAA